MSAPNGTAINDRSQDRTQGNAEATLLKMSCCKPPPMQLHKRDAENSEDAPRVTSSRKKRAASVNHTIPEISSLASGVTVANVAEEVLLPHALSTLQNLAMKKSVALGIPMPNAVSVITVRSGNPRNLEEADCFATAEPYSKGWLPRETQIFAAQQKLDWTTPEGLLLLQDVMRGAKGSWIFLEQTLGPITPAVIKGLIELNLAAKKAGVYVMLVVVCSGGLKSQLENFCTEYIEVSQCEPDIGVDIAFSIDCVGIRALNTLGIGKTMCSVRVRNGAIGRRYKQFISADHQTRIMWYLRGQGNTLSDIAEVMKVNKSTVSRRLQGLPPSPRGEIGKAWLSKNMD